jgi:hypothetical protein
MPLRGGKAGRPSRRRRRKLEKLVSRGLPDRLVLTPATTDVAVTRTWMLGHSGHWHGGGRCQTA